MATVRETVRLGLAARGQAKLKVRQPLRAAVVVAAGARARRDRAPLPRSFSTSSTSRHCATSPRPTSSAPTRSSPTTARSARASASTCRRSRRPSRRWTPGTSQSALRDGATRQHQHRRPRPRARCRRPERAMSLSFEGSPARARGLAAVALELELDEELRREGLARESSTRSRTPARARGCRSRTGSRSARRRRRPAGGGAVTTRLRRARDARAVDHTTAPGIDPVTIEGRPLHIAVQRA